ncbi:MAG TPA: hypothetical protein VN238_19525 [Solirubrobacteraceae bacterium]|nr:hypothetical protein [Solirubrobacteraceae bacterium]
MPPDHPPACRVGEILPNAHLAIVSPRKLRDYALNPDPDADHDGRHKARVFAAVLDIHQRDWQYLRDWLLLGVRHWPVVRIRPGRRDGWRYEVVIPVIGRNGMQAPVTTGWVVEGGLPRLATAYIRNP